MSQLNGGNVITGIFFYSLFNVDRYVQYFNNIDRQYTNKNRRNGVCQKLYC